MVARTIWACTLHIEDLEDLGDKAFDYALTWFLAITDIESGLSWNEMDFLPGTEMILKLALDWFKCGESKWPQDLL